MLILLSLTITCFIGCEDDPILSPSNNAEEECTGSYCSLKLSPLEPLLKSNSKTAVLWHLDASNPETF